jgi:hypothetical protein
MTREDANARGRRNRPPGITGQLTEIMGTSGFDALYAGLRTDDGIYGMRETGTVFWTATEDGRDKAWYRSFGFPPMNLFRDSIAKGNAYSVRCLKDSSKEETGSKEEASKPKGLITPGEVVILDDYSDFEKIFSKLGYAEDRLNSPPSRCEFESKEDYQKRIEKYKDEINKDVKQIQDQLYKVTLAYSNLVTRAPFYGITLKEPLKFCLPGYNLEEEYFALSNIKFAPDTTMREWGYLNVPVFSLLHRVEDPPIKIEKSIAKRVRDIEDKLYLDLTFKVVDAHTHHPTTSMMLDRFYVHYIDIQPIKMTLRGEGETFWQWEKEE